MAETKSYDWKFVKSKYNIEYDPDKTFNFKIYNLGDDISNKNTPIANSRVSLLKDNNMYIGYLSPSLFFRIAGYTFEPGNFFPGG